MTMLFRALTICQLFHVAFGDIWMHVTVKKIQRKPCIIDETSWGGESTGCAQMSYMTLDERILPHHERRSTSFEFINGVTRPTVTHWPKGKLADWMISLQFISVDPVYGIARTCDRSGYIRVFQNSSDPDQNVNHMSFAEKTVEIQGQCFTASVQIQASTEVCPWCMQENLAPSTTTTTQAAPFADNSTFLLSAILGLTIISVLALVATGILLVVYILDRREEKRSNGGTYEMPSPISTSTLPKRILSTSTWSTKSSEQWCEYPTEVWRSYHHVERDQYSSPDSGLESV